MYSRYDCGLFYTVSRFGAQADWQSGLAGGHRYLVSMHYLNRNGEILWNTCPIQLGESLQN